LPRGSVKRRSTYLTSLSLIDFRTSLAVFMNAPYVCGSMFGIERQVVNGMLKNEIRPPKQP
jgi:hypothetical protein